MGSPHRPAPGTAQREVPTFSLELLGAVRGPLALRRLVSRPSCSARAEAGTEVRCSVGSFRHPGSVHLDKYKIQKLDRPCFRVVPAVPKARATAATGPTSAVADRLASEGQPCRTLSRSSTGAWTQRASKRRRCSALSGLCSDLRGGEILPHPRVKQGSYRGDIFRTSRGGNNRSRCTAELYELLSAWGSLGGMVHTI